VPAPSQNLDVAPVTLLRLEYAGRVWRLSSRPIDVEEWDGVTRLYRGGLAGIDLYQESGQSGENEPQSQTFDVLPDADIASLVAEFHDPSEIRATVAQIVEGNEYGQARIYLTGPVEIDSDGFEGKPIRLKVTADDPAELPGTWPPSEATVNDDTWGDATSNRYFDAKNDGDAYPTVFGSAGEITSGGSPADVTAVPAIPVGFNTAIQGRQAYVPWGRVADWATTPFGAAPFQFLFLSYGWLYPGEGTNKGRIKVFVDTGTTPATVPPESLECSMHYFIDALGQKCTLAWANGTTEVFPSGGGFQVGRNYYAAIRSPCGGVPNNTYTGGVTGAGELIRWALERSDVTVDWRRTTSALAVLDRYKLAGFWDQPCEPWAWLVDNVFPLLPCSWVAGPNGVYPVLWRLNATSYTADARLTDGLDCTISGPIKNDGDPLSRHVLDYASGLYGGTYRRRATWHGKTARETARETISLHLARAQQRYGSRRGSAYLAREQVTTTDMVYADRSADRILSWWSRVNSQPARVLRVVSDGLHHRGHFAAFEPGMCVSLTSDRYSLSSRVAYVRRAGWLGGVCYADLVILSEP